MSDRMIPVPESALRALAERRKRSLWPHADIDALVACLPEPEPTFTDEEALAFYRAAFTPNDSDALATEDGHVYLTRHHVYLTRLAKAGWTAPKALCPPPSPAQVELVEAARECARGIGTVRLRAAVAAYDEQEG